MIPPRWLQKKSDKQVPPFVACCSSKLGHRFLQEKEQGPRTLVNIIRLTIGIMVEYGRYEWAYKSSIFRKNNW